MYRLVINICVCAFVRVSIDTTIVVSFLCSALCMNIQIIFTHARVHVKSLVCEYTEKRVEEEVISGRKQIWRERITKNQEQICRSWVGPLQTTDARTYWICCYIHVCICTYSCIFIKIWYWEINTPTWTCKSCMYMCVKIRNTYHM